MKILTSGVHEPPRADRAHDLHAQLRAATSGLHEAVERGFAHLDLAEPADYARFLALQAAAILPLEAALDQAGIAGLLPDWAARRRADALLGDLATLGDPKRPLLTFAARPGGEAMGVAYVLEGSRLGGAILARRLPAGAPDGFLRHGRQQGLWPGFLARLAMLPEQEAEAAETGACRAFRLFLVAQAA